MATLALDKAWKPIHRHFQFVTGQKRQANKISKSKPVKAKPANLSGINITNITPQAPNMKQRVLGCIRKIWSRKV